MTIKSKWICSTLVLFMVWAFSGERAGASCPQGRVVIPEKITDLSQDIDHAQGKDRVRLLIRRGQVFKDAGLYDEAMADFSRAKAAAERAGLARLALLADYESGYLFYLKGDPAGAEDRLRKIRHQAHALDLLALEASIANRLAVVLADTGRTEEAYPIFQEALNLAEKARDPGMQAVILCNTARIVSSDEQSLSFLVAAQRLADRAISGTEKMDILLGIGAEIAVRRTDRGALTAFDALNAALVLARANGDLRRQSQCLGTMGKLYYHQGQFNDAQTAAQAALILAQAGDSQDLPGDLEFLIGRLFRATGKKDKAVSAFRRAIYHITRQPENRFQNARWQGGRPGQTLTYVNRELADLLLSMAAEPDSKYPVQDLLREARQAIESGKLSELRDYFRDPCLAALSRGVETLGSHTAVFYPILLPDRVELLVEANGTLYRKTASISRTDLEGLVLRFTRSLRKGLSFRNQAKTLYTALIGPIQAILDACRITTIVYVPDGVLRLLPLSPLMDNGQFLLEKYSFATAPGLSLLEPSPIGKYDKKVLLAGMSDPGPVIFELPQRFWNLPGPSAEPETQRQIRGLSLEYSNEKAAGDAKNISRTSETRVNSIKNALALPGVKQEIQELSSQMPGKILFNDGFQLDHFFREMAAQPYNIVHIASHGYFGGRPEENFIMTFDHCLNMNHLERLIRPRQLADQPVELITLSACQTAEGDDRSPLGLAGVVLKSGARSALGSLWPVSDQASQLLFPVFYARLNDPGGGSKADALRSAQLSVLKQETFSHPFYWSAFILIGNWL